MILPVIALAQIFSDMGISSAIIQHKDITEDALSSLYWLNILSGLAAFCFVFFSRSLVIRFYDEPQLNNLFIWMACIFLITPIGQQFQMLLQRNLEFQRFGEIEIISIVGGSLIAIGSALAGNGALSIVLGTLATAAIRSFFLAILGWKRWRPRLHFRLQDTRGYLGFGLYQIGDQSVNYLATNIDYIIIGKMLGTEILGIYTIAYQLVVIPQTKLNPILTRVAFPLFARKQDDNTALRRGYLETLRLVGYLSFPLIIGLAATASLSVPVVLGEGWEPAIHLIQILAILGILKAIGNPLGSIYLAKGRPEIGFYFNIAMLILNTSAFLLAVRYGIYTLAIAYVVVNTFMLLPSLVIIDHLIELKAGAFLRNLLPPLSFSLLMGGSVYAAYLLSGSLAINDVIILTGLVLLGMVIYASACWIGAGGYFRQMWALFFTKERQEATP